MKINLTVELTEQEQEQIRLIIETAVKNQLQALIGQLPTKEEKYLTISQVARLTQFERATVYKWINSGKLSTCTIGNKKRVTESALNQFMQSPEYCIKPKTIKNHA